MRQTLNKRKPPSFEIWFFYDSIRRKLIFEQLKKNIYESIKALHYGEQH